MKASLRQGKWLPESQEDFITLKEGNPSGLRFVACTTCRTPFEYTGTKGERGWRETQLSGTCGDCWEEMLVGMDDGGDDTRPAVFR